MGIWRGFSVQLCDFGGDCSGVWDYWVGGGL